MANKLLDIIVKAIYDKNEFGLLEKMHKNLFKKKLDIKYINYSLDCYNLNKDKFNSFETKIYALDSTLKLILDDYSIKNDIEKGDNIAEGSNGYL